MQRGSPANRPQIVWLTRWLNAFFGACLCALARFSFSSPVCAAPA
jgi:hypothetical protein